MKIGDLARKVGVTTSTIRFYEEAGLLPKPNRSPSGYREYESSAIERLAFIKAGQAVGLTLAELRSVINVRDRGEAPCRHVAELIDRHIDQVDQRLRDLRSLRKNLIALADAATDIDPVDCSPQSVCRIVTTSR